MGRKKDEFWAYAVKVNGRFKCNFCEEDLPGGASRIKAHLAGIPGHDIKACNAVPREVQEKAQAIIQKKREAQATQGTNKKLKSASTSASKLKNKRIHGACKRIPSTKLTNLMTTDGEVLQANAIETICLLFLAGGTIDYNCKLMNRGGMYILDIERAIFKDKKEAGVGLVIRVAQGLLIAVMSKRSLCMNPTKLT